MQLALFDSAPEPLEGFRFQSEFLTADQEDSLLETIRSLDFRHFRWHEHTGKRRTVIFGWKYSFDNGSIEPADALPDFLLGLRAHAARWAGVPASALEMGLIT